MDNKYYQPKIEEFCIGFEFEKYDERSATYKENNFKPTNWHKFKYDLKSIRLSQLPVHLQEKKIRVKYLDQQDIENLGWEHYGKAVCNWYKKEGMFDDGFASYGKWTKLKLLHCSNSRIKILAYEPSWGEIETVLFAGECKNKSELKKLMQQLNIKGN